jgi:hypothetical protein
VRLFTKRAQRNAEAAFSGPSEDAAASCALLSNSPQNGARGLLSFEKLEHNGLAGRGHFVRVSHSFGAAPGGLCA